MSILIGSGDGTFQQAKNLTVGKNPTRIAAGDFNSDGNADLLVIRGGTPASMIMATPPFSLATATARSARDKSSFRARILLPLLSAT